MEWICGDNRYDHNETILCSLEAMNYKMDRSENNLSKYVITYVNQPMYELYEWYQDRYIVYLLDD